VSYDELDAERDKFFDDLYKEFRASALDDAELYDKIADDFKASRLRAFYADNPLVAEAADGALAEARPLLQDHPKAALVFAVTSAELCMRRVLLTPILHGAFHTESSGEFLVRLLVATKDEKLVKALVAILASHTGVDLRVLCRAGVKKPLWEDMRDLQVKRNEVVHQGAPAAPAADSDAQQAVAVAGALLNGVFPAVIRKLGLHLHETIRVCDSPRCETSGNALTGSTEV
jgi:hypothetical protein